MLDISLGHITVLIRCLRYEDLQLTQLLHFITPPPHRTAPPHTHTIPYPAFSIHLTFALLQSFLEHRLISLAAELLLSTDTDMWMPLSL